MDEEKADYERTKRPTIDGKITSAVREKGQTEKHKLIKRQLFSLFLNCINHWVYRLSF